jgi:hypothetical protein
MMKERPYTILAYTMGASIFFFGYAVRICESPLSRNTDFLLFYNYTNCIWNIIITMTTVGYGDYYAKTDFGRFVIFFVCLWGVSIVSIMTITLTNTL